MALPHSAKPTITVDVHAWSEFKGDTSHGILIPTIQKRSIFRGIQLADFTFHPIKKNNGTWLIADSFSIKIATPDLASSTYR